MRPVVDLGHGIHVTVTTRADGDLRPAAFHQSSSTGVDDRWLSSQETQRSIVDLPWNFVRQVHGNNISTIDKPVGPSEAEADGLISASSGVALAMLGADCSLIGLASPEGVVGVVHAGWKGLLEGVIEAGVAAMRDSGARTIDAVVGPTIGPECYAFSVADLGPLTTRYGDGLRVDRADGSTALNVVRGVEAALQDVGVRSIVRLGGCTACEGQWYSWRARREEQRHALVIWREAE